MSVNSQPEGRQWSAKEAAIAGQKFRREARRIFAEYQQTLFKKLEEVRIVIRPRPRFFPRKVWLWFADIFVDLNNANKALVFETPQQFLVRKHVEEVDRRKAMGIKPVADNQPESEEIEDLVESGKEDEVIHTH